MKNLSNYVTIFRLLLVPVFLITLTIGDTAGNGYALLVFLIASLSDAVDGIIARKTGSISSLGRFLDPMADKLLIVTGFIALTVMGKIPLWLSVIVISRDIILFFGWLGIYVITNIRQISPTIVSKFTTFMQMTTVVMVIIGFKYNNVLFVITGGFTVISGVHYIIRTAIEFSEKG